MDTADAVIEAPLSWEDEADMDLDGVVSLDEEAAGTADILAIFEDEYEHRQRSLKEVMAYYRKYAKPDTSGFFK